MGAEREKFDLLHVGADLDRALAEKFRLDCESHHFFKRTVLSRLIQWWLSLPDEIQEELYHRYRPETSAAKIFSGEDFREAVKEILREEKAAQSTNNQSASS